MSFAMPEKGVGTFDLLGCVISNDDALTRVAVQPGSVSRER
jgi:hypothetical protein